MATSLVTTLSGELAEIEGAYQAQFAGQARRTRDLGELDALVAKLRGLAGRIDSVPAAARTPDLNELYATAQQTVDMYQRERELIVQAKNAPPEVEDFAPLAASANFVFAQYARHFAGRARAARDVGLLDELVTDLERIAKAMKALVLKTNDASFRRDLELVEQNRDMYKRERGEIEKAAGEGSLDERASLLAEQANAQFRLYQTHFAGRSRSTRRPGLLVRMIAQLRSVQDRMRKLKIAGLVSPSNDENVGIVNGQIQLFEKELEEVRAVRKATPVADLMGMLGGAANDVFAEYRAGFEGKNRRTCDLELLSDICDRLQEVRRQMEELARIGPNENNEKNLDIVATQLQGFEREWELVKQAQEAK